MLHKPNTRKIPNLTFINFSPIYITFHNFYGIKKEKCATDPHEPTAHHLQGLAASNEAASPSVNKKRCKDISFFSFYKKSLIILASFMVEYSHG